MIGKIYGLIGPNGGGKSYKQRELHLQADTDVHFITADFSDGIRELLCRIITGQKHWNVDTLSEAYARWKEVKQEYFLPDLTRFVTDGRSVMQNIGEAVKDVYPDFWAKYTGNIIFERLNELTKEEIDDAIVCFGSVRFDEEISVINYMHLVYNKPLEFVFCNYWDAPYRESIHQSEELANKLIKLGYKHNDIIKVEDLIK
jgi:hypothetical protein